ncbi:MAG: transposase [Flavobacteriales bacterium]|nr:transposase [Flavobacteriales bacterium]
MKKSRRKFTSAFKTKVVLEALKERSTIQELAQKFELHPAQITLWKKEFLENAEMAFTGGVSEKDDARDQEVDELYKRIGRLNMENEWLKKKLL